jgi:hypothetical protein
MLERAQALARDPSLAVDDEALLSAASNLVAWGAFNEALKIIERLESQGLYPKEIWHLRGDISEGSDSGKFENWFLTKAIEIAKNPASDLKEVAAAASDLVRWGAVDEADIAIARMEADPRTRGEAASLKAASRQLRRSGILSAFSAVNSPEAAALNRPYEVLVAQGGLRANKAVVVFTGVGRRFWLSLQVLYHFLRKFDAHVIYLSDHSGTMYLNGLDSVDGGYPGLLTRIGELIDDLGVDRTFVMGSSSGGFMGLRAACDIGADAFLGLGIKTDVTPNGLPISQYEAKAVGVCRDAGLAINLRTYLAARRQPRRIALYAGDGASIDVAHAENLRGLPNVELFYLQQYSKHMVIPGLLARGQFAGVLQRFLAAAEPDDHN